MNSALDDPINYFAASDHTQKASDLQVVKDGMSEGIQTINAASEGIDAIIDLIDSAKSIAKSALSAETEAEITTLQTQYNAILDQIDYLVEDSGYAGINLLDSDNLEIAFDESGTSKITVSGIDASTGSGGLNLIDAASWWSTANSEPDSTVINGYITDLETAKTTLRSQSQTLSSQLSVVTTRQDFTANMIDLLEEGAGELVNADTTEEGVKLTTLETQQALAVQALSITSSASQAVLNLFS